MMKKLIVCVALFATVFATLNAEVYSLFPFGKKGRGGTSADTSALLQSKRFLNEKITANGMNINLSVSLVDMPMTDAVLMLKKEYPNAKMAANSNSLLLELPLDKNMVRRIYLLQLPGIFSVLEFKVDMPATRPVITEKDWPKELPLVEGASNFSVMRFAERDAVYGSYTIDGATETQLFQETAQRLERAGWKPLAGESANLFSGTGEVYMSEKPLKMMILGVNTVSGDSPGARVSFYTRPIK